MDGHDCPHATRLTLDIEGMHCASCVSRVERALRGVRGVREASVNFGAETATVHFDSAVAKIGDFISAVEGAGYSASVAKKHEPDLEARQRATIEGWRNRLVIGVVLMVPIVVLSMAVGDFRGKFVVLFALGSTVQAYLGWPYYRSAVKAARHFSTNMDTLIAMGSSAAYAYSVAVSFFVTGESVAVYYDGAAMILTLITLGKYLEAGARFRTSSAIRKLMELSPQRATVIRDGREERIDAADVQVGDALIVRPGEKRRGDRRRVERGRVDDHRRERARGEGNRRRGDRRNDQPRRLLHV